MLFLSTGPWMTVRFYVFGFESRRMGSKKPATELVTGFSDSVVPPAGCPRAAGAARFRCVAPLLACCAGKRLRVSSAPHPVGFESRRWRRKKPVTTRVTGFAFQMVPPAGFEPAISTLKGWRPWPLDDGDSGKEYSRLFCRRVYRWQTGKPPQRCPLIINFIRTLPTFIRTCTDECGNPMP